MTSILLLARYFCEKKSTSTPLFLINESTSRTSGVNEIRTAKKIKKNQHNRPYIDYLVEPTIICSEDADMKSYDLSTVSEEEQYINNIPTKISNKNLGIVDGQYANKLRHVTYENKKEYVHRKKKLPITYTNLPILETITTKLSRRERQTTTNHQQNQNSIHTYQPVLETTEKIISFKKSINIPQTDTSELLGYSSRIQTDLKDINHNTVANHRIGKVDRSSSNKIFQVDESYTMQDIPHKKYSNK